uniref:Uncharacterized protein n=1 Tax=Hyaloperonospora arabidopsidis (strain Emoy2) TaxID=559515 RepID=M4BZK3_HYAAE
MPKLMVTKQSQESDETESESEVQREESDSCASESASSSDDSAHNRYSSTIPPEISSSEQDEEELRSEKSSPATIVKETRCYDAVKCEEQCEAHSTKKLRRVERSKRTDSSDSCLGKDREAKGPVPRGVRGLLKEETGGNEFVDGDWQTQLSRDANARDTAVTIKTDKFVDESDTDSDTEWRDNEWEHRVSTEDEEEKMISLGDVNQAKFVLRNITSRIPLVEETAIRRSVKLSGPPLEFATTHSDEHARKFRWPQHTRNLRNTNFVQDPIEILEDFELLTGARQPSTHPTTSHQLRPNGEAVPLESAFARIPRPMVALAAEALCRSSQKRKRINSANEGGASLLPPASTLLGFARIGGRFSDHFVGSLIRSNGKALHGTDDELVCSLDKRCWSSLPTKKKPVANWRFILEHVQKTIGRREGFYDAVCPAIAPE